MEVVHNFPFSMLSLFCVCGAHHLSGICISVCMFVHFSLSFILLKLNKTREINNKHQLSKKCKFSWIPFRAAMHAYLFVLVVRCTLASYNVHMAMVVWSMTISTHFHSLFLMNNANGEWRILLAYCWRWLYKWTRKRVVVFQSGYLRKVSHKWITALWISSMLNAQ